MWSTNNSCNSIKIIQFIVRLCTIFIIHTLCCQCNIICSIWNIHFCTCIIWVFVSRFFYWATFINHSRIALATSIRSWPACPMSTSVIVLCVTLVFKDTLWNIHEIIFWIINPHISTCQVQSWTTLCIIFTSISMKSMAICRVFLMINKESLSITVFLLCATKSLRFVFIKPFSTHSLLILWITFWIKPSWTIITNESLTNNSLTVNRIDFIASRMLNTCFVSYLSFFREKTCTNPISFLVTIFISNASSILLSCIMTWSPLINSIIMILNTNATFFGMICYTRQLTTYFSWYTKNSSCTIKYIY